MRSRPCPRANREAGQREGVYNQLDRHRFRVLVTATNGRGMRFAHSVMLQHKPPTHHVRPAGCTVSGML